MIIGVAETRQAELQRGLSGNILLRRWPLCGVRSNALVKLGNPGRLDYVAQLGGNAE